MRFAFRVHQKTISAEGFRLNRLITECIRSGIVLQNVSFRNETEVHMTVSEADYTRLLKKAKHQYRITVLSESGCVPFLHALRLRRATLIGLSLFFIILYYQSLFVREIRITGYEHYTEAEVREALDLAGLREGVRKPETKSEADEIRLIVYQTLPETSFVGLTCHGTLVEVVIAESGKEAEQMPETTPCDIISDRSGYVAEILPTEGLRAKEDGEFVLPGDVLITGTIPYTSTDYSQGDQGEQYRYVRAAGRARLRVPHFLCFTIREGITDSRPSERFVSAHRRSGETVSDFVKRISDRKIREFLKENLAPQTQILNKHLNFYEKENIIEVKVLLETLEETGEERRIEEIEEIQEIVNGN